MGFGDGDGGDKSLGTLILARNLCFDFDCDGNCDSNLRLHFCRSQIALSPALALLLPCSPSAFRVLALLRVFPPFSSGSRSFSDRDKFISVNIE
jgi:hypothetical protein